jgi:hypothetical protein
MINDKNKFYLDLLFYIIFNLNSYILILIKKI